MKGGNNGLLYCNSPLHQERFVGVYYLLNSQFVTLLMIQSSVKSPAARNLQTLIKIQGFPNLLRVTLNDPQLQLQRYLLHNHNRSFQACIYKEPMVVLVFAFQEVLHNSCNLGTCDLPEMYALSTRTAPSDFGQTFQANHSCPCYHYKMRYLEKVA